MPRLCLLPLLLAVAVSGGCTAHHDTGGASAGRGYVAGSGVVTTYDAAQRRSAPDVAGKTLDGRRLDLAAYRGDVVVLNFWASWCPPCRDEADGLAQVARDTARDGVRFVGVNVKDDAANARIFAARHGTPYPSLLDRYGEISVQFGRSVPPQAVPTTLVLDRQGRVAVSVFGPVSYSRLLPLVRTVAAGRPA